MPLPASSSPEATGPYAVPDRPDQQSYWQATTPRTDHAPLQRDVRTQVAVVGGGIAGLTAAYFLARAGRQVTLLERYHLAEAETGHTTAHLTHVVDSRLRHLKRIHGDEAAKASWVAGAAAMDLLERIVQEERIPCRWQRVDGILYGDHEADPQLLREEADIARAYGFTAELVEPGDVPFPCKAALRFPGQAKFHPREYALGLTRRLEALGVDIHEGTAVHDVDEHPGGPGRVRLDTSTGATVWADTVIAASNVPVVDKVKLYTKLYPYRSYVIGARVPHGDIPDGLWWSTFDPAALYDAYHYARVEPGEDEDLVILGGEDHKVGHSTDPEEAWARLERYLSDALPDAHPVVEHRWSGQIIETLDGLPYIGVNPLSSDHVLVATGFSGNGMTFGTIAGWMLAERAEGRTTPYDAVFEPSRAKLNVGEFLSENAATVKNLLTRPLKGSDVPRVADIAPGQGAVLVRHGEKVAVHRGADGELACVSAICTHLGCVVGWNAAEGSWDCGCHGSRFRTDGGVINGPARQPLAAVDPEALAKLREEDGEERRKRAAGEPPWQAGAGGP